MKYYITRQRRRTVQKYEGAGSDVVGIIWQKREVPYIQILDMVVDTYFNEILIIVSVCVHTLCNRLLPTLTLFLSRSF